MYINVIIHVIDCRCQGLSVVRREFSETRIRAFPQYQKSIVSG
jgi:hypothetical protein